MKAIKANSKRALLMFLSVITLSLVLTITLPVRLHRTFTRSQITQVLERKEIRKIPAVNSIIVGVAISALLILPKIRPWTGSILARAPPLAI